MVGGINSYAEVSEYAYNGLGVLVENKLFNQALFLGIVIRLVLYVYV